MKSSFHAQSVFASVMAVFSLNLYSGFSQALALEHPILDKGVVDLQGKEIIPCRFDYIKEDNNGLFYCFERKDPKDDKAIWTRVYNRDGKQLFATKDGIIRVTILHEVPEGSTLEILPPDTVISIFTPSGRSLIDLAGKELVKPHRKGLTVVRAGDYIVIAGTGDGIDYSAKGTVFIYDTVKKEVLSEPWRIKEVCDAWLTGGQAAPPGEDEVLVVNAKGSNGNSFQYLVNVKERRSSLRYQSISDSHSDLRIVGRGADFRHMLYGIIDSKFRARVAPEYSEITFLRDNRYLARKSIDSAYFLMDGAGKKVADLPPGDTLVEVGGDIILCKHHSGNEGARYAALSVVDPDGKVMHCQENYGGSKCFAGTALLVEKDRQEREISYTVVTAEGVVARGVKGYELDPVKGRRLIKSVFVRYPSAGKI